MRAIRLALLVMTWAWCQTSANAQAFNTGSTGTYGPLNVTRVLEFSNVM
jgi:hypothetical protein